MSKKMLLLIAVATVLLSLPAHAYEHQADATSRMIMDMVGDLGGHNAVGRNSGKTLRCLLGGTRKVTVTERDGTTTFRGDYRDCRQKDLVRDGIYEFVLKGDDLIDSKFERSVDGKLFDAAKAGDAAEVRKLLKAKANVNHIEKITVGEDMEVEDVTPLMAATMAGSLETVKGLVSNGAWVNYLNGKVLNALWIAANNGKLEIVKYLVGHGAYVNNRNVEDVTPLMAAAMNGHLPVVKFLAGAKAALNVVHKEGDSALMFALANRHTDVARFLIDAGADVNIRNRFGVSALIISTAEGNEEIVAKLLQRGADAAATTDGKTALDVARSRGFDRIAKLLESRAGATGASSSGTR